VLATDPQGRLHSAVGPALSFSDGWSHYAWKGVAVPSWLIEERSAITPNSIRRTLDPVQRRCMIEIMTPARFVAANGAKCIAEDWAGRLWRASWGLDFWSAVEVVNGTPENDGSRTRYFLQVPSSVSSPVEAVAWTYGISVEQYSDLTLRT
jgi:hypothetical protein